MKISLLIPTLLLTASLAMAETQGTMIDKRDGQKYKTVKIGSQTWMAENLNYKANSSVCYKNEESNCAKYGRRYMWATAVGKPESKCGYGHLCSRPSKNIRGICPSGWHLPSKEEFETLFKAVGGIPIASKNLKSKNGWNEGVNGTDDFGFSAIAVDLEEGFAHFWSSTEIDSHSAYLMGLAEDDNVSGVFDTFKIYKLSIRCLKNQ